MIDTLDLIPNDSQRSGHTPTCRVLVYQNGLVEDCDLSVSLSHNLVEIVDLPMEFNHSLVEAGDLAVTNRYSRVEVNNLSVSLSHNLVEIADLPMEFNHGLVEAGDLNIPLGDCLIFECHSAQQSTDVLVLCSNCAS